MDKGINANDVTNLSRKLAALGNPRRLVLLMSLPGDGSEIPVSALGESVGMPQSTVSGFVTDLYEVGLIRIRREGRWRYIKLAQPEIRKILDALKGVGWSTND